MWRRGGSGWLALPIEPVVRLWILRILVDLGAEWEFLRDSGFRDNLLARQLGLNQADEVSKDFDAASVRAELRRMLRDLGSGNDQPLPEALSVNVTRLSELVGLCEADRTIFTFAILLQTEPALATASSFLGDLASNAAIRAVAAILDLPHGAVANALKPRGTLSQSGLLRLDYEYSRRLDVKLELLSEGLADMMRSFVVEPIELLRDTVSPAPDPLLAMSDDGHVAESVTVLLPYLRQAIQSRQRGVNVLLHGAPGTGKTELCRVLARQLGADLYEISSEDDDGDPIAAKGRLMALRVAQSLFLSQVAAMLVFDEIEDVFASASLSAFGDRSGRAQKAWLNGALESNTLPVFWLCNSVECLDPAYVRRFDVVLELPIPPRRQRERIIRQACGGMVDEQTIQRLALHEGLSPAVIARAGRVVGAARDQLGDGSLGRTVEALVTQTLRAQGHTDRQNEVPLGDGVYDPSFINADADLPELATNLRRAGAGRVCLHGPPGTGKTAFARWLSHCLDKPLIVKRASDLLGAFVGENEKNIAAAFRDAHRDGAVLLIDEIETFLNDRRGAHRSWEASLVNEMLTQMECYQGIFIASTNAMDLLDMAALRRFDVKIELDYLRPEQARELLRRHCAALGLAEPCIRSLHSVVKLGTLTPGDFAIVARRSRLSAIETPEAFVTALSAEGRLKSGNRQQIGFAIV